MTTKTHLPECDYVIFDQQGQIPRVINPGGCICRKLRACEERVLDAAREAVRSVQEDSPFVRLDDALDAIDALRGGS